MAQVRRKSSTPPKKRAAAPSLSSASASGSAKKKKLEWKPKASVVAALGGIEPSPLRCNPDRPIKKLYNSDEYMSGSDIEVSSEEEIEVTSEEESDDEHEEEDLDRKPSATANKPAGTPDEYKEVEALDLGTMERVGLYRATADAAAQLSIEPSTILKACRDGGGYVEQYFIRFANEDGAAHAADITGMESVYQPTEEEVQRYIERARMKCAESAAQKRDEDDAALGTASAASSPTIDAEERYGDLVDNLTKEVMKFQQGSTAGAETEAAGADDAEVADARQQLIRHQLLYRMKMADRAGVAPERFCKRYLAQLKINDEQESKAQKRKKARGEKKKTPKKKAGKTKADGSSSRSPATSRTIGAVRSAAEAAIKKRKSEGKSGKSRQGLGTKDAKTGKVTGHWSEEEDLLLLQALTKYGHDWSACSTHVKSRTHIQCKSRHQKMEMKGLISYD